MKTSHLRNPEIRAVANELADTYDRMRATPSRMVSAIFTLEEGDADEVDINQPENTFVSVAGARHSEYGPATPHPAGPFGPVLDSLLVVRVWP
jgi:hypothetical protein